MKEKERKRVLDNFYIKEMKKGRAKRAYIFDKIALWIFVFFFIFFVLNKFINNMFISLIFTIGASAYLINILKRKFKEREDKRIEKIKEEYKKQLIEEDILKEDDDIDEYVIEKYKKRKEEFKSNVDIYAKGKSLKLYALSIVFMFASYFVEYSMYYKIMGVVAFVIASFIASRKLTEYVRQKDNNGLLDRDIDV